jgi:hypothetical protein
LSDNDLLGSIVCSNGQLVRYLTSSGTFSCDNDFNTIPSPCATGQVVVYDGTTWTCKTDSDVLAAGIPSCSGALPYLKYRNGVWTCTDQFFVLNYIGQPGFLTYIQTANILDASSDPQAFTAYTVLWGSINQASEFSPNAPIFPFNGTVTSTYIVLQNFQSNTGATVAVDFTVDGVAIANSISFTVPANPGNPQTITYLSPVFSGQSFTAGQAVSISFRTTAGDLSSAPPTLSSVFTAVYISVSI